MKVDTYSPNPHLETGPTGIARFQQWTGSAQWRTWQIKWVMTSLSIANFTGIAVFLKNSLKKRQDCSWNPTRVIPLTACLHEPRWVFPLTNCPHPHPPLPPAWYPASFQDCPHCQLSPLYESSPPNSLSWKAPGGNFIFTSQDHC